MHTRIIEEAIGPSRSASRYRQNAEQNARKRAQHEELRRIRYRELIANFYGEYFLRDLPFTADLQKTEIIRKETRRDRTFELDEGRRG